MSKITVAAHVYPNVAGPNQRTDRAPAPDAHPSVPPDKHPRRRQRTPSRRPTGTTDSSRLAPDRCLEMPGNAGLALPPLAKDAHDGSAPMSLPVGLGFQVDVPPASLIAEPSPADDSPSNPAMQCPFTSRSAVPRASSTTHAGGLSHFGRSMPADE